MSVIPLLSAKFPIDWKQRDCIEKVLKKNSPNYRVYAFEDLKFKKGCRKFIAVNVRDFYLWYRDCNIEMKHFYELVLESYPCRLYFDMEFQHEFNKDLDGIALVQSFCKIASAALEELLGMPVPLENFFILDSSSSTKFSAHIIVHIHSNETQKEILFPDNLSIKPIVMFICSKLLRENCCLVKTDHESRKLAYFCDLTVYSRNRNFRLFQSSKFGKQEHFKFADYCNFYENRAIELPKNAQIFLDSLVIPFDYNKFQIIDLVNLASMRALNSALELCKKQILIDEPRQALLPSLTSILRENQKMPISLNGDVRQPQSTPKPANDSFISTTELCGGADPSPFPKLDVYMLNNVFKKFNALAEIRIWRLICTRVLTFDKNHEQETETPIAIMNRYYQMQYQINFSRFCMNRGREHRSNNVYWVVNFSSFYFFQRCFDKLDCPNYISPAFAFPREICEYLYNQLEPAFTKLGIPADRYTLPDLDTMNRFQAVSDSFDKSLRWRELNETVDWLELFTSLEEQQKQAEEEERKMAEEEEEKKKRQKEADKENQQDKENADSDKQIVIADDATGAEQNIFH